MAHNEVDFSPFHQEIQGALYTLNGPTANPINGWFCTAIITNHVVVISLSPLIEQQGH